MMLACSGHRPPPLNIYLSKSQIVKYKHIALRVSSSDIDVKYSREELSPLGPLAAMFGILPFLVVRGLEATSESIQDRARAKSIGEKSTRQYLETLLSGHFTERIRKANLFSIERRDEVLLPALLADDFDALIELKIEDLCLKRMPYSAVMNVLLLVTARMTDVRNGMIIWSQRETDIHEEAFTFEAYKADDARILKRIVEEMFAKIAARMANDIIYSK
jgi:hypothetical protein